MKVSLMKTQILRHGTLSRKINSKSFIVSMILSSLRKEIKEPNYGLFGDNDL